MAEIVETLDTPEKLKEQTMPEATAIPTIPQAVMNNHLGRLSYLEHLVNLGRQDPGELFRVLEEDPLKVSVDSPTSFVCPPQHERFSEP
ncbi:unnamed protein product, partial [Sphacelaria rigidula]